ncbi:MAG: hypothetical protein KY454_02340 [Actinobacteria bacterium]|nr:hypothetical protein [Actinomycetota bacterium]
MDAPLLYKPHPALFPVALLGGVTGTVFLTALLRLASALGMTVLDLPPMLGSLLSSDSSTSFDVGHAVFVVTGIFVIPLALALLWPLVPGDRFTFRGALAKGALFGLVLALLTGMLVPLLGLLSRAPDLSFLRPGPFALGLGLSGPVQLLVGTQLYSLTFALVAAMARGLQPLDAVGWGWWSHGSGESP